MIEPLVCIKIKEGIHRFFKSHSAKYGLKYGHVIDTILRNKMNEILRDNPTFNKEREIVEVKKKLKLIEDEMYSYKEENNNLNLDKELARIQVFENI